MSQSLAPAVASSASLGRAVEVVADAQVAVLTGAGMSTDSGIPDYRGPGSVRATPMQYAEFVGSREAQRRYWARSYLGFQRMGTAVPNAGHRALARWQEHGVEGLITQNVDGLHLAAGSRRVVELHGEIAQVVCLACGSRTSRRVVQERLALLNPQVGPVAQIEHSELRPDGDAVVTDWSGFRLADCTRCAGPLKPDVVFFGERVPLDRVAASYALVDHSDALLVAGSSLTVMSGLRFVRHAAKHRKPVVIINRGPTRGDEFATVKLDAGCSETLTALADRLA